MIVTSQSHLLLRYIPYLVLLFLVPICSCGTADPGDGNEEPSRPHVLLLFTDQQHMAMMSAAGNPYLHTPNMDRLAERGVLFKQSYCTSPVCGPARSSIISGRMPHETGVEWNGDSMRADVKNVGEIFREAGYQTTWGGKWHLPVSYPLSPRSKQKTIRGFDLLPFQPVNPDNWMLGAETDPPLTEAVVEYLEDYKNNKPLFLAVSYHNPHDICFYARKEGWVSEWDSALNIRYYNFEYPLPEVVGTHPSQFDTLPPLPENHPINAGEPEFLTDKRLYHEEYGLENHLANEEFGDLEWRGYLNAYHRLTEMVDIEIGKVLDALERKGMDENTIIVFTSDHGDGAAAHKWAAKLNLYQEPSTVPLIVSWPKTIAQGRVDAKNLVSQIDIVPTLCDYAGLDPGVSFTGRSMRPILQNPEAEWREYLVVELGDYEPDRSRKGRMVRSGDFKYNIYTEGARNEQLFNLKADPLERENLAFLPEYAEKRKAHLEILKAWISDTKDNFSIPSLDK